MENVERGAGGTPDAAPGAAARAEAVQAPIIPDVAELIRANPGTISLGQGVVHYPAPPQALRRMADAMADPERHRYGDVAGIPPLLEGLGAKLRQENGIETGDDAAVLVTAGGNMAFVNALLAIADPGDEVILLTPYYFNHEMAVGLAGCRAVLVETDDAYQPRLDALRQALTERTRAVVTVSPNNPTGVVYDEATLRAVNDLCRARGIYHISDEAYEYFTYDGVSHFSPGSIAGASAHTISLFTLSKAYAMAAWRVGYMVVPRSLLASVRKIQDTILICPPLPSQHAALGALEAGRAYARSHLDELDAVRRLVGEGLARLGDRVVVPAPSGAFYYFVRVRTDVDDLELLRTLVERHGVAALPGSTFGMRRGCYLRVAYGALERETVARAVERLVDGLGALPHP